MRIFNFILLLMQLSFSGEAKVFEKTITYQEGDNVLEGVLFWESSQKGKRPGVLIVHDWMGLTDKTKARAEEVAKLGYLAFAVDIYGKGIRPADQEGAAKLATQYKENRAQMRARIRAAYDQLANEGLLLDKKIAVMGYCFGGTVALELARSGADITGAVSFHGALATPNPEDAKQIKGKVLALHGADDPWVPDSEVANFEREMRNAKVDWELVKYGNSVHSFTDRTAGSDPSKGAAYNAQADKRSWEKMRDFFGEVFGRSNVAAK